MAQYTPGHDFYGLFVPEIASITEATPEPTLTTTHTYAAALAAATAPTIIGHINPFDIVIDDGDVKGFGAGAQAAVYDQEKGRTFDLTINQRVTSLAFVARCLPTTPGAGKQYGLPETAILYGTTTAAKMVRSCVCNQFSGSFSAGSGSELSITAAMMGIYPDSATLSAVPTYNQLQAIGAPASWHDMTAFTIGGTSYLQELVGISWTQNHNVERKSFRPTYTGVGLKASRCVWALLPHHINGEGELNFHSEILTTSNAWGNIVATIGATTWTWINVRPATRRQPGVESSAELGWSTPFTFDYMTVA